MKIGYIRVSKQEQNEALQRDALKAAGCGKYLNDKMTGSKFERKGLEELLAFVRSGDTVVVWKLNRLGRSLRDLIETLTLLNNQGVDFISLTENIDTTTPSGKLIFHVMGALAEFERDLIRERTNAGLAAARARGRVGGQTKKAHHQRESCSRSAAVCRSESFHSRRRLGPLAQRCIAMSKGPNHPRNYRNFAHGIPKFTP